MLHGKQDAGAGDLAITHAIAIVVSAILFAIRFIVRSISRTPYRPSYDEGKAFVCQMKKPVSLQSQAFS